MNYYNIHMSDYEQYIVKPADSLYMIAKKYGVSVEDLKQTNHLVSNIIYPNQILFIPKNKYKEPCVNKEHTNTINDLINKYSLTLNEISRSSMMADQGTEDRDIEYYVIKSNDTLEDILLKFELTPIELLKLNEKKFIVPGEKIIIDK